MTAARTTQVRARLAESESPKGIEFARDFRDNVSLSSTLRDG